MHWTRPECAYCTSGTRAAASRPALTPARDRPQPARRVPLRAICSPSPQRAKQSLAASPASQGLAATAARQPCPGRRRPSLPRLPAAPWSFASLSAASSPSARRRHVAIVTERRFAVVLIAGHLGTDLHRVYKGPGAQSSPRATSYDPPSVALASSRAREGLLPRVRPVRSPPSPGRFHHHQCLYLSILSTKNSPFLSRTQPLAQFWPETTAAQKSLCPRSPLRRGARRRRLPPPPATLRPPEGPPWSGGSIPALRCPRRNAVRRRRSPDAPPRLGTEEEEGED